MRSPRRRPPRSSCRSAARTRGRARRGRRACAVCRRSRSRALGERVVQDEVDELGHERVGGAARALVRRDDEVGEHAHRLPLVRGEELRRVGLALAAAFAACLWTCSCAACSRAAERAKPAASGTAPTRCSSSRRSIPPEPRSPVLRGSLTGSPSCARRRCARPCASTSARMVQVSSCGRCVTNGPAVGHEQVLRVVGLAPLVEHRRARARRPCAWCPTSWMISPPVRDAVVARRGPGIGAERPCRPSPR